MNHSTHPVSLPRTAVAREFATFVRRAPIHSSLTPLEEIERHLNFFAELKALPINDLIEQWFARSVIDQRSKAITAMIQALEQKDWPRYETLAEYRAKLWNKEALLALLPFCRIAIAKRAPGY